MQIYGDTDGDSNVYGFEIYDDAISVWFHGSNKEYTWSYDRAGSDHVENMKELAIQGNGLNSYIQRRVKFSYDR
ncbi:hypothetical protein LC147_26515 [Vibrio harveyi]|uniref:hypothetical protein n=1 Tax=Vibrio harveyi TaxID=669 RepID=UPI003BB8039E